MIDINHICDSFRFDFATGDVYRKRKSGWVLCKPSIGSNGYKRIGVCGKRVGAHRLIWALLFKQWPEGDIDHKNGIRTDNRLVNLRHVDRSTNLENTRSAKSNNKSTGLLGAYKSGHGRFSSRIQVKGEDIYLGVFSTAEEAHAAYIKAKREFHAGATI